MILTQHSTTMQELLENHGQHEVALTKSSVVHVRVPRRLRGERRGALRVVRHLLRLVPRGRAAATAARARPRARPRAQLQVVFRRQPPESLRPRLAGTLRTSWQREGSCDREGASFPSVTRSDASLFGECPFTSHETIASAKSDGESRVVHPHCTPARCSVSCLTPRVLHQATSP